MRRSELIYNTHKNIINTSSDICFFNYPGYEVSNISSNILDLNSESSNVFVIDGDIEIPIEIGFTTNLSYLDSDVDFNYQILPLNQVNIEFTTNGVYTSDIYTYDDSATGTTYNSIVNTANLRGEGEYLMKVGYQYKACTQIAEAMGKRYVATTYNDKLPFGHFDTNHDKYFVVLYRADEPLLDVGITAPNPSEGEEVTDTLKMKSLLAINGVSEYALSITTNGDLIIVLNGLVLTSGEDYTYNGTTLVFAEPLKVADLVNYIFIGKDNTSGLKSETISIDNIIQSGTTGNQGRNDVYFNTDSNKFEIYTEYRIKNPESLILSIKGVLLTNQIDYYVSSTDSKRIILQGNVFVGDWLNVIYDSGENIDRAITEPFINISWYVTKPINDTNGEFIIEFSEYEDFLSIAQSEVVSYVAGKTTYDKKIDLFYDYGTVLYYRVRNVKKYSTISGDSIDTENVSDSIRIEIKTNISNNY